MSPAMAQDDVGYKSIVAPSMSYLSRATVAYTWMLDVASEARPDAKSLVRQVPYYVAWRNMVRLIFAQALHYLSDLHDLHAEMWDWLGECEDTLSEVRRNLQAHLQEYESMSLAELHETDVFCDMVLTIDRKYLVLTMASDQFAAVLNDIRTCISTIWPDAILVSDMNYQDDDTDIRLDTQ